LRIRPVISSASCLRIDGMPTKESFTQRAQSS
jgi:hypothetical protein